MRDICGSGTESTADGNRGAFVESGVIPRAVTVYAAQRVATHAGKGCALLIYPESGALVSAISENGKLSFACTIDGGVAAPLELELPQLTMTAELQGISASFQNVLVDEKCFGLRDKVEQALASPTEMMAWERHPHPPGLIFFHKRGANSGNVRSGANNGKSGWW